MLIPLRTMLVYSLIGLAWGILGFTWGDPLGHYAQKGDAFFEAGQYDNALEAYTDADVQSTPDDPRLPQLYLNMGNTLSKLEKPDQAVAMYHKTLEAADDAAFKADVHYNSGNAWLQQHQYQQAIDAYTRALEL
ncbi:tetratricopeptide repeat protein, partial [candidate division KSB3 bacterium]|nr:tetratricopeptide repeat protein [candidate division KSB3 bacterium]MBD3326292.1 tetratricopeptide repeat protein [candidate division KSB3 bacterium]